MNWNGGRFDLKGLNKDLDYILAILALPVSVVMFGQYWRSRNTAQILFWLIFTLILSVKWPFRITGALTELHLNRLWIFPLILPVVVLIFALVKQWSLVVVAMVVIAPIAPFLLLFLSPRKTSTAAQMAPSDRPHE
jgi:hypothetical protein